MANRWGKVETVTDFILWGSKITADGDRSHEIKGCLLLGRKVMTNLEKEMATHSSVLAWRIPGTGGAWWAAVSGVAQSWTRLKRLGGSSSSLVIAFLPRSKRLLISWLQSPSAVILEPKKIKSLNVSIVSPYICHKVMGPDAMVLLF